MSDASSAVPGPQRDELFFGTYTERMPHVDGQAPGIMRAEYTGHGHLSEATLATVFRNPSWVTAFNGVLYAVSETHANEKQGEVSAYRIDRESGTLVLMGMQLSGGADPAHLAVSPDGRYLAVANYSDGSVALFSLQEGTGRIGEQLDLAQHEGEGPDVARQTSPHPHMVAFAPTSHAGSTGTAGTTISTGTAGSTGSTHELYVPDLGMDAVLVYRVTNDKLVPAGRIDCTPGSGPRHLAFHPSGDVFFLVGELDNTLTTFQRTESGFVPAGSVSLLPEATADEEPEPSAAAAVRVSSSGELIFASNRGHNSVSVFRYSPGAAPKLLASVPVRGRSPRDIALTPDEQYLFAANQDSHSVTVFNVDAQAAGDNVLSFVGKYQVPSPVCLAWA